MKIAGQRARNYNSCNAVEIARVRIRSANTGVSHLAWSGRPHALRHVLSKKSMTKSRLVFKIKDKSLSLYFRYRILWKHLQSEGRLPTRVSADCGDHRNFPLLSVICSKILIKTKNMFQTACFGRRLRADLHA